MAAHTRTAQNAILGLAVQQVLGQHPSGSIKVPGSCAAVYEEHFAAAGGGAEAVGAEAARQHFSSLLQVGRAAPGAPCCCPALC